MLLCSWQTYRKTDKAQIITRGQMFRQRLVQTFQPASRCWTVQNRKKKSSRIPPSTNKTVCFAVTLHLESVCLGYKKQKKKKDIWRHLNCFTSCCEWPRSDFVVKKKTLVSHAPWEKGRTEPAECAARKTSARQREKEITIMKTTPGIRQLWSPCSQITGKTR